jgi:hypothetical protein
MIPQALHILVGGAIRRFRHLGYVIKQGMLCRAQAGFFQVALCYCLHRIFFGSLNTQEVCMRVQSIRTAIEPRHPACDRFLGFAVEMTLGKVDGVAELHHVAQKVRAMAEALQNARHLLAARFGAPFLVDLSDFSGGIAIFDELDFGLVVGHFSQLLTVK